MRGSKFKVRWSGGIVSMCLLAVLLSVNPASAAQAVKYVFFFIGDGMAATQLNSAEVYLSSLANPVPPEVPRRTKLTMSKFPVQGMITTFGNNSYIPDSADAGTSLACGKKTNSGVISMDPSGTVPFTSTAKLAKAKGMKVGIVSSVSIDHATPAVFYANNPSRDNYYEIAMQMADSDFDYFAGGGVKYPNGKPGDQPSVFEAAIANGFTVAEGRDAFEALTKGQRAITFNSILDKDKALYYELDRKQQSPADHVSLAEFTRKGIEVLDNPQGFFMMVEGGKIDWACHANDARASIDDVIAFSDAIKEAYDFYLEHPSQTLIVVTGDHETGGMSIGFAGAKYATHFEVLESQNKSYIEFDKIVNDYKAGTPSSDVDATIKQYIGETYGMDFDMLSSDEKQQIEEAYDRFISGTPHYSNEKDYLLYGGYNALSVTLTHILNQHAGIGWTTYSHTGVPVPVYAIGSRSEIFGGFYDNTGVARRMATAMRVKLNN
jgi:alkaline phosphatase